jgi:hypothetical protein
MSRFSRCDWQYWEAGHLLDGIGFGHVKMEGLHPSARISAAVQVKTAPISNRIYLLIKSIFGAPYSVYWIDPQLGVSFQQLLTLPPFDDATAALTEASFEAYVLDHVLKQFRDHFLGRDDTHSKDQILSQLKVICDRVSSTIGQESAEAFINPGEIPTLVPDYI